MANIRSAKKRIKVIEKKTLRNKMVKSALKTVIKKFDTAVLSNNLEDAKKLYINVTSSLDKSVSKGVLHKNTAARKKSRLAKKLNSLNSTELVQN